MLLNWTITQQATFEVLEDRLYNSTLKQVTITCRVSYGDVSYDKQYTLTQEQTEQRAEDDMLIIDMLCQNNNFTYDPLPSNPVE